jgi:hypothetical protein
MVTFICAPSVAEGYEDSPTRPELPSTPNSAAVPATVNRIVNGYFKALSHPIRRGIVERLAGGPATVGDTTGACLTSSMSI